MSYRGKRKAQGQPTVRLTSAAHDVHSSPRANMEPEGYRPVLPHHVEGHTDAGRDVGCGDDIHVDPQHSDVAEPGTSTPFTLDFTTLSDMGIVSHGHFQRHPYPNSGAQVDDSDETQPPDSTEGDEDGVAHDTHFDDAATRPLKVDEVRTISVDQNGITHYHILSVKSSHKLWEIPMCFQI
ncbi:uncharacterized protein LOC132162469 [Corylus avellana]|uniref:uncharacterized protein LOC132162469 n=1 Tax=Corylus avellana TaxID=13451 RepID=UPI00286B7669|nr:uncharacterized protein LOC132162469 [Corylus avellana]